MKNKALKDYDLGGGQAFTLEWRTEDQTFNHYKGAPLFAFA